MTLPTIHVFTTDFGDALLTDGFVKEAEAYWPDRRYTRIPRWVGMVHGDITQLVAAALAKRTRIKSVKSLSALGYR